MTAAPYYYYRFASLEQRTGGLKDVSNGAAAYAYDVFFLLAFAQDAGAGMCIDSVPYIAFITLG